MTEAKKTGTDDSREARLKAALKANMARRKAQARARDASETGKDAQGATEQKGD